MQIEAYNLFEHIIYLLSSVKWFSYTFHLGKSLSLLPIPANICFVYCHQWQLVLYPWFPVSYNSPVSVSTLVSRQEDESAFISWLILGKRAMQYFNWVIVLPGESDPSFSASGMCEFSGERLLLVTVFPNLIIFSCCHALLLPHFSSSLFSECTEWPILMFF